MIITETEWHFRDTKEHRWAFGTAALEMERSKCLSIFSDLLQDTSVMGLMRVKEQELQIAITLVHWWQPRTN